MPETRLNHTPPLLLYIATAITELIDAISYQALGHVFTANMTGNVVFLAFAVAGAPGLSITRSLMGARPQAEWERGEHGRFYPYGKTYGRCFGSKIKRGASRMTNLFDPLMTERIWTLASRGNTRFLSANLPPT